MPANSRKKRKTTRKQKTISPSLIIISGNNWVIEGAGSLDDLQALIDQLRAAGK